MKLKINKKNSTYLAIGLLVVLFTALIRILSSEENYEINIKRPVKYQKAESRNEKSRLSFSGKVKYAEEPDLSFKVTGTVETINVKSGDIVKKGDVLLTLDDADFKLSYQDAEANVERASALLELATQNFNRILTLYEHANVSLDSYQRAEAEQKNARSQYESAVSKLKIAENRLSYTKLEAPFKGTIGNILIDENELVNQGMPVVEIINKTTMEVHINVPSKFIKEIKLGEDVIVIPDDKPGKRLKGIIKEIDFSSGRLASTNNVIISLVDFDETIISGTTAQVTWKKSSGQNDLLIPLSALSNDVNGEYIYKLERIDSIKAKAVKHYISIGKVDERGAQVLKGLNSGELFAVAGVNSINDGMIVIMQQ